MTNYPWLTQSDKTLAFNVIDTDDISFDGRYEGFHEHGRAEEAFSLVVCAVHPPATIFETGQELKEFVMNKEDQEDEYTVTLGQFTATQDAACGSLEVSVTTEDQGTYNPTSSGLQYVQSADKLTHTFKKPWQFEMTLLQVKVSFKFSLAQDVAHEVTFKVHVYDCHLLVPELS